MNWSDRNLAATMSGKYTEEDATMAHSYATCAVSERIGQLRGQGIEPLVEWMPDGIGDSAVEIPLNRSARWAAVMFDACVSGDLRSVAEEGGRYTPRDAMRWYAEIQAWEGQS